MKSRKTLLLQDLPNATIMKSACCRAKDKQTHQLQQSLETDPQYGQFFVFTKISRNFITFIQFTYESTNPQRKDVGLTVKGRYSNHCQGLIARKKCEK